MDMRVETVISVDSFADFDAAVLSEVAFVSCSSALDGGCLLSLAVVLSRGSFAVDISIYLCLQLFGAVGRIEFKNAMQRIGQEMIF